MTVKSISHEYHTATPYLIVKNSKAALEFYQDAFGAETKGTLNMPDGTIMHGEFVIGDSHIMFTEESPEMGAVGPETLGGAGMSICLYVNNADDLFNRAVEAGAEIVKPLEDQFWGDRSGTLLDPYGHSWTIMTKIEDLEWVEVQRRFDEIITQA